MSTNISMCEHLNNKNEDDELDNVLANLAPSS